MELNEYCVVGSLYVSGGAFVTVEANFGVIKILMLICCVCVFMCYIYCFVKYQAPSHDIEGEGRGRGRRRGRGGGGGEGLFLRKGKETYSPALLSQIASCCMTSVDNLLIHNVSDNY